MIFKTLSFISDELNEYFRTKFQSAEDRVILSAIVKPDGSIAIQDENKIIVTLVNIQKDAVLKSLGYNIENKVSDSPQASMNIVLHVLFSANFNDYAEALKCISLVLSFFHQKSTFNRSNAPRLPDNIEKLVFEEENLNTDQLSNVWATIGAKYMPSLVYKIKLQMMENK